MSALDDDLPQAKLPPLWLRRAAAVSQFAFYGAGGLLWWASGGPSPTPLFAASVACFAVSLAAFGFLAGRYLFLGTASDCVLDEREREARNRAYRWAYEWSGAALASALLYHLIALDVGWPSLAVTDAATGHFALFGVLLVFMALPGAIIAWSEPSDAPASFGAPATGGGPSGFARWRARFALLASAGLVCGLIAGLVIG